MNYAICCDFRSIMRNRNIAEALLKTLILDFHQWFRGGPFESLGGRGGGDSYFKLEHLTYMYDMLSGSEIHQKATSG